MIISDRSKFKVASDEANLKVSTYFEESRMSVISEVPCVVGVPPASFCYFINNWLDCVQNINPLISKIENLESIQGYCVGKTTAECPWPLSKRITIAARYPCPDFKEGEHMILLS